MRTTLLIGGAALAAAATAAAAAPVLVSAPTVTGATTVASTVHCTPGQWTGASSFTYTWQRGGFDVASGQDLLLAPNQVGGVLSCHVVAADGAGGTTAADSAPFTVGRAQLTMRVTLTSPKRGVILLKGTAAPTQVLVAGRAHAQLTVYRLLSDGALLQISNSSASVPASGRVTLRLRDTPGRHRYKLQLSPPDPYATLPFITTLPLRVKR